MKTPAESCQSPTRSSSDGERAEVAGGATSVQIIWLLRLVVGGLFVLAGALKMMDPAKFAVDVANYRLLPHEWNNLVAILIPAIEVLAGLLVLAGVWLRAAALVITNLTVMFFFVIVSALARGLNLECGCFGTVGGQQAGLVNLAIDLTLFLLAIILVIQAKDCRQSSIFREAGAQISASPSRFPRRPVRQAARVT